MRKNWQYRTYCGGCGHPAAWLRPESDAQEMEEYKPFRDDVDKIEVIVAKNPWSMEDIMQAFVERYESENAVIALQSYKFHRVISTALYKY